MALAVWLASVVVPVAADHGPAGAATEGYQSLPAPVRLADTRPTEATIDGRFLGPGKLGAGRVMRLQVTGRAALPAGAAAVMLNVTVAQPEGRGFVTIYPCDQAAPTASALNFAPSQAVANAAIATLAADGTVCLFTPVTTHLIVDAAGWFPTGSYLPLPNPQRVFDSRPGQPVVAGGIGGIGRRPAGSVTAIPIAGRAGVPDGANAVALNITTANPDRAGYLTAFPCDASQPLASNLNYAAGATVPGLVITRLDDDGRVCVFTFAAADVIVDVSGTLPAPTFTPLATPQRALDTRPGERTADGQFQGEGAQPAAATLQIPIAGRVGVPAEASAVVLNVTAINPVAGGYVTVHPRGTKRPNASNLNSSPQTVVANSVVARVGAGGEVCVFNYAAQHLVVDVAGWLTGPPPPTAADPCPSIVPTDASARDKVVARPALHRAIGVDRIAVIACDDAGANPVEPEGVAAWANEQVAPYFAEASQGRFRAVFETHPLRHVAGTGSFDCLFAATRVTNSPFTNVMVYTSTDDGGGFGGPGFVYDRFDTDVLAGPPSVTQRGFYVGGGVPYRIQSTAVHELGHSIHWPHSYTVGSSWQYDNPVDVMSGIPVVDFDPERYCEISPGTYTWCEPQGTLAFNRLAAGWVDGRQVAVHQSGRAHYTLDRPAGAGVQMVAVPHPSAPRRMLTVEARPAIGRDANLAESGVAVHLVDQGSGPFDVSTERRHAQAAGAPDSYEHVLLPGETLVVAGVRVTVLRAAGEGFQVRVVGTYAGASIR
jgi:hypothetical protein